MRLFVYAVPAVFAALAALAACGKVNGNGDASTGEPHPMCADPTSIDTCGASCAKCTTSGPRTLPTCDGTACGVGCVGNAPKCNDNSCSQLVWSFTNGLEGVAPSSANLVPRVAQGPLATGPALALDVTNLTEVSFHFPICLSGTLDVSPRKLTTQVFFQGGTTTGDQFFVQASTPDPASGNFFGPQLGVAANTKTTWTGMFGSTAITKAATQVTFQAGSFGAQFTGTIWFDDITIE
jgi:hypothetical protein